MKRKGALCVFVKTPGFSPVKTRLATNIGQEEAKAVYCLCLKKIKTLLVEISEELESRWDIFWAVAEQEALQEKLWSDWPSIHQGEGGLGERLSSTHSFLKDDYKSIAFIGADSPLMCPQDLTASMRRVAAQSELSEVMPTEDGGYSYIALPADYDPQFWKSIAYSSSETFVQTKEALEALGQFYQLEEHWDIDDIRGLRKASQIDTDFLSFL